MDSRPKGAAGSRRSWFAFLAATIILLGVAMGVVSGMRSFDRHADDIEHSHQVIIEVGRTVLELRTAEASQRLHLLTGSAAARQRHADAALAARRHLDRLSALARPESGQPQRIGRLHDQVDARLSHLDEVLAIYTTRGSPEATAAVTQGVGLSYASELIATAREIVAIEEAAVQRGHEARGLAEQRLRALAIGGILLSLAIVALVVSRLLQENTRRRQVESGVREQVDLANAAREDMVGLSRYAGLLQSCRSMDEALSVSRQALGRLLPDVGGALYLIRSSRDYAELSFQWGVLPSPVSQMVALDDCWALRRGQPYEVANLERDVKCSHVELPSPDTIASSACIPMSVQGEALGILFIATAGEGPIAHQPLAAAASEQLALALFNLRLQEQLQTQSIRDVLTGLFNRRYLEESLSRELARAQRRHSHASVLMIDVDHFKRFNDSHGHDAGDAVLRELGRLLEGQCRARTWRVATAGRSSP